MKEKPEMSAYVAGLTMLGRRELSEAQLRQRLLRKGYESDEIGLAVDRLKHERALDDARVAGAIARTQTGIKRRGRLRVQQELARAGISGAAAKAAVTAAFQDVDDDAMIEASLRRRLRGAETIADDKTFQRLYRYLVSQGFEHQKVLSVLRKHKAGQA